MVWIIGGILVILLFLVFCSGHLWRQYQSEAVKGVELTGRQGTSVITQEDLAHLPGPIQKYLRYVGVLGKEKVHNYLVKFDGGMKADRTRDWMKVQVQQYSFTDITTRLFFMTAKMFGLPVIGLHAYKGSTARMKIKIAGLIPVVNGEGEKMNQSETVTVFNDMCLLAPATLIDKRIQWELIDDYTVKAKFRNQAYTITATLYFNEEGQLTNFVSDDRFLSETGKTFESYRWSTPISDYQNINGYMLPTYGEAVWSLPEGDFSYIRFRIKNVEYNVKDFR